MTLPQRALRHQDIIITVFAMFARPPRQGIRIAHLLTLMSDLGYDASGVRSAISRLKSKGILGSTRLEGQAAYTLDSSMTETIADGDIRIFAEDCPHSAGQWVLATFSVPESRRALRHQIRSSLIGLGFGNAGQGLWIAPAANLHDAEVALRRRGLGDYVEFFVGTYADGDRLTDKLQQWWDLDALNARCDDFADAYSGIGDDWREAAGGEPDREAFRRYVPLLTEWRELPYAIPPLPLDRVPDGWSAPRARAVFYGAHGLLADHASAYADRVFAGDAAARSVV